MPFTADEISTAGMTSLDFYVKNNPVDQVAIERALLKDLNKGKKSFPGAKEYVVEQIRNQYQSNFQWFNGSKTVTYNKRKTVQQAKFPWRSAHDGFALDEDRLAQNGITMIEGKTKTASRAEVMQLTNLLDEENEVLRLGFEEKFDQALWQDGSTDADAIDGIDALINIDATWNTVGGINSATAGNEYWRNHKATGLTTTTTVGTIWSSMRSAWRACVRNGGRPDKIYAGSDFVDGLQDFMMRTYGRLNYSSVDYVGSGEMGNGADGLDTGMRFNKVPIIWVPSFADLDALSGEPVASRPAWEKRCYFINTRHLKLRPMDGHDMIVRKPPRTYDKYEYYWGLTWRGGVTTNRRNAHAALSIA